jgi:hypothetical protein
MKTVRRLAIVLVVAVATLEAAGQTPGFPAGTLEFFNAGAVAAIPAGGGGVWVLTPEGIVRYTTAGKGTVLTTPGGLPELIEQAGDGSIWFSNSSIIGRMAEDGTVLEQYAVGAYPTELEVATDGALWYLPDQIARTTVGRIANGVRTEHEVGVTIWSLSRAPNAAMWALPHGFGASSDDLRLITPAGGVTVVPLGINGLFGEIKGIPEGTQFISTGYFETLFRLLPGAQTAQQIAGFSELDWVVDGAGNVWSGEYGKLHYYGLTRFTLNMPVDPRSCSDRTYQHYEPLIVDNSGALWVRIRHETVSSGPLPPPPCGEPAPPPLPDLIRIDVPALLAASQSLAAVPVLSPMAIAAMILALACAAGFALRG